MEVRRSRSRAGIALILAALPFGCPPPSQANIPPPAYELYQPENSDFKDWTEAQLRERIGADALFLDRFVCDTIREFEIFTPLIKSNPRRNSLRARLKRDSPSFIYRDGQWFDEDGTVAELGKDRFYQQTAAALAILESLETGRTLLRQLESSPETLFIEPGRNSFAATIPGRKTYTGMRRSQAIQTFVTRRFPDYVDYPLDAIGSGGYVYFDPHGEYLSVEDDGVARPTPAFVILAHEMYHAYDGVRGLLDRRFVWSEEIQSTEVTEIRASYFENLVRREAGRRYKKYYGGGEDQSGPGLLDRTGAPILIPAPCLSLALPSNTQGKACARSARIGQSGR